jgi:hypothetical protein
MSQNIVPLAERPAGQQPWWSNCDLALFHRATSVLEKAGLSTETDSGVTDEGEPWLVFWDAESDEVIAHVAHISGTYVVWAPILTGALTGSNLADLMERFLQRWLAPSRELQVTLESITALC